jgi:peptidoglycan/xylan/chitin deacetylase (PgdA/CDA1 family)
MFSLQRLSQVTRVIGMFVLLTGCFYKSNLKVDPIHPQYIPGSDNTATISPTPFQALTNTPSEIPPTLTPTMTDTPVSTDTPTPTDTPIPTSTPALELIAAGHVKAPILLYHHISDEGYGNRYYVTLADFRAQMEALKEWGYTSITVSQLVKVLLNGGELPLRPVVITFDDGNLDVYQNAFPIMREVGFIGTNYIVVNRLQSKYFMNVEQLQELSDAGWEIGSHSMTHTDLTTDHSIANYEIRQSLLNLENATGEAVSTFAYPYGETDEFITTKVSEYGYSAGMGLGLGTDHYLSTLFYLSRIEIHGEFDLSTFVSLLPWADHQP